MELALVDVGIEGKMVLVSKEQGYFAHREPQFEEFLFLTDATTFRSPITYELVNVAKAIWRIPRRLSVR
jgi:hypothetical protein